MYIIARIYLIKKILKKSFVLNTKYKNKAYNKNCFKNNQLKQSLNKVKGIFNNSFKICNFVIITINYLASDFLNKQT